jgi:hypothetical protein
MFFMMSLWCRPTMPRSTSQVLRGARWVGVVAEGKDLPNVGRAVRAQDAVDDRRRLFVPPPSQWDVSAPTVTEAPVGPPAPPARRPVRASSDGGCTRAPAGRTSTRKTHMTHAAELCRT